MASLMAKRKKNKLYYYVVDSARVQGCPRIVHQTYLGSAEKVAALLKERPLRSPSRPPAANWACPERSGWRRSNPVSSPCCSPTPLRFLPGSLPVAGGDASHLLARSQDRGGRLVSADHSLFALGLRTGALLPPKPSGTASSANWPRDHSNREILHF